MPKWGSRVAVARCQAGPHTVELTRPSARRPRTSTLAYQTTLRAAAGNGPDWKRKNDDALQRACGNE